MFSPPEKDSGQNHDAENLAYPSQSPQTPSKTDAFAKIPGFPTLHPLIPSHWATEYAILGRPLPETTGNNFGE